MKSGPELNHNLCLVESPYFQFNIQKLPKPSKMENQSH